MKNLCKQIQQVFTNTFGRTPLRERLDDIQKQASKCKRFTDLSDLKNNLGNLLASSIQLANENEWDIQELVEQTLNNILSQEKQYKSLGRKTNVCLFGGSFNPIHLGHIELANTVLQYSTVIDEVWLCPANNSLYGKELADPQHRINMCEIAAKHNKQIKVCDWEIRNNTQGETYKLMKEFMNDPLYTDKEFWFAIGLDNAYKAPNWVNWKYLKETVQFIVLPRKGIQEDPQVKWFLESPHIYIDQDIQEVSSTQVKNLLTNCDPQVKDLLDDSVLTYIKENNLYG